MRFTPPQLPESPGVYIYKNDKKDIIYVGKAKSLKKRVASYFNKDLLDEKTKALVANIAAMDFIVTNNELEAFLLENRLIKHNKPKYNIDLKDNERYAYIKITAEEFPRLHTAREKVNDKGRYYGPYVAGFERAQVVRTLNSAFKLRACKVMPKHVCLYYHTGRCSGPCEDKISKEDYLKNVQKAENYLQGKSSELMSELKNEMAQLAKKQEFERAREKRDAIHALENIRERQVVDREYKYNEDIFAILKTQTQCVVTVFTIHHGSIVSKKDFVFKDAINADELLGQVISQYYEHNDIPSEIIVSEITEVEQQALETWLSEKANRKVQIIMPQKGIKKNLVDLAMQNAAFALENTDASVKALQGALKLPETPRVIECFDISTIQGNLTVASMVQFVNGKPSKENYRRYRIKGVDFSKGPDDFASMREVVRRRFLKLKLNNEPMPDLVIIDGGKGQLNAAIGALKEIEVNVSIISLAKREEEVFVPGLQSSIKISHKEDALKLLQRIRDEAHRFAITYHRLLRDKKRIDDEEL